MRIKTRSLNIGEKYACNKKDIKRVFPSQSRVFVSFGLLGRDYHFDSSNMSLPSIKGRVISSFQINNRLSVPDVEPILCFFVIKDDTYQKHKTIFVDSILPQMYEWYQQTRSKTQNMTPGIEELLVEWVEAGFDMHIHRYQ